MTTRSIRRAAERRANKLARKAAQQSMPITEHQESAVEEAPEQIAASAVSPAVVPAEAANTCLTAVAVTLTGQVTLLPTLDAGPYNHLLSEYQAEFRPVGLQESTLVQSLAEIAWRMRRLVALEMGIFARGHIEFAPQFAEHKPEIRASLIEVHTFLTYEKQIRGLQLQEARLARRAEKQTSELRSLQTDRHKREATDNKQATEGRQNPKQSVHSATNGFEFANRSTGPHSSPANLATRAEAASTGSAATFTKL